MNVIVFYHNRKLWRLKQKIKNYGGEAFAKSVSSNKNLNRAAVFVLGSMLYFENTLADTNKATAKIDGAGAEILSVVRSVGYWICIVICIVEIIKALLEGDTKGVSKIMIKYAFAFASLFFFPWILDFIKEVFS